MSNFSIYSILREAPEDNNQDANKGGDDFNIDASLNIDDDNGNGQSDSGNGDMDLDLGGLDDTGDDVGGDDLGGGDLGSGMGDTQQQPVQANTDMFTSLSTEEQKIKIKQLKLQYMSVYNSFVEFSAKIDDIETDENNIIPMTRILSAVDALKTYIADYLFHIFPTKSFYENDVMLDRFLYVYNSLSDILKDIYKTNLKDAENQ